MILVDTSIWVNHLREGDSRLAEALTRRLVVIHPFVVGEIACGRMRDRGEVLRLLRALPLSPVATHEEALAFIEERRLMGRGIGYVDVHLLASTALAGTLRLWSGDRRLVEVASELGLALEH